MYSSVDKSTTINTGYNRGLELARDVLFLIIVYLICVTVRILLPRLLGDVLLLVLVPIAIFSRKEHHYLIIAFLVLLTANVGELFQEGSVYSLPSIGLPGLGRSVEYYEIIAIAIIIRSLTMGKTNINYTNRRTSILIIYGVFLFLYGLSLGIQVYSFLKFVRLFMIFQLIWAIPQYLKESNIEKLFSLILFIALIVSLIAILERVLGNSFSTLFGITTRKYGRRFVDIEVLFDEYNLNRSIYGIHSLMLAIILGGYELVKKGFRSKLVLISVIFSYLAIFLSATRGWLIGASLVLLSVFLNNMQKANKLIIGLIIVGSIVIAVLPLRNQAIKALERYKTLEAFAEGDKTADGTLSRVTKVGPIVWNKYVERPVLGFGFSDEYAQSADTHVGWQTMLLNGGIIGLLVWVLYWSYFSSMLLRARDKSMLVYFSGLITYLFIHTTSRLHFSYHSDFATTIHLSLFFYIGYYHASSHRYTSLIDSIG